jgi:PAS domain S-box-containing protein
METLKGMQSQYARSLIEASRDSLFTLCPDGKIAEINNASIVITGITREHLIGSDFFEYFTEPEKAQKIYKQVFTKGFIKDSPLSFRHKNGKLTDVLINGSVYKDDKGNILGAVLLARDIAEQRLAAELRIANKELAFQNEEKEKNAAELILANKEKDKRAAELFVADKELVFQNNEKDKRAAELIIANKELIFQNEEKEKQLAANKKLEEFTYSLKLASQYSLSLIEASRDPLFTISPEGKITDINNASINITESTREQLIGTDFFEYFTEPVKARDIYKQVFAEGFVADYPLTIRDGKLTDFLFNGSVYKDEFGKVVGVVVVARDITDHNRIEKELIEAKVFAELATEIAIESKNKAEEATKIAENAVKSKQQFLSNMSHEIRTPMNAIIGFTKVLLKSGLTLKQKEYLNAIKLSGDSLIVLINDILDLAKVDSGKMAFEQKPFKMASSISAMIHLFETKILEKNLQLVKKYDSNIPKVLVGDAIRLHQIILNLVSNAVKFTTKGKITVSVQLLYEDEEKVTVEFAITDTGIGIPEDRIKSIFENFQQATSDTSRLYGGTGLGLAISKQLVESQGGSISVKSKPKEGSTFSFILPFMKTNAEAELEIEIKKLNVEVKNIKVLVVEDIALNQLLMKTLLDDFGFEHDIAGNGKIAIEKLQNKTYDIILMDLMMPEMNGFEATEYIRYEMNSQIPIIALTADVTTTDLQKCKNVGMNDYIAKPIDERQLYIKIIDLLKKPSLVEDVTKKDDQIQIQEKCIDLTYMHIRTKSNPLLMKEMITLYLHQTPPLINNMKQSLQEKDWDSLYASVHKLIPSFSIVGIHKDFENIAKKIQEYASTRLHLNELEELVLQIENVCSQACQELEVEINLIKNTN